MFGFPELNVDGARAVPILDIAARYAPNLRRDGQDRVGPCPTCGGTDRFAVNPSKGVFNCRGCGTGGDGIALVQHVEGVSFVEAVAIITGQDVAAVVVDDPIARMRDRARRAAEEKADRERRIAAAVRIVQSSVDASATPVEWYLATRGLGLDKQTRRTLLFHPSCPFGEGERHPCMIAPMHDVRTGELVAVHRTALTANGEKLGRKMLGCAGHAAVMLDEVGTSLVVGEGIESCLAARLYGLAPAWAMTSAGAIERLPVLPGVQRLTLLEERDENGVSARAVAAAGARWAAQGREVEAVLPPAGKDMNDALIAGMTDAF